MTIPLYEKLNLLKLDNIYKLEIGKIMYKCPCDNLPDKFNHLSFWWCCVKFFITFTYTAIIIACDLVCFGLLDSLSLVSKG